MIKIGYTQFLHEFKNGKDFIDVIGWLGPFIIMAMTVYYLWKQKYLYGYFIFYIFATFINTILKNIFKQARPTNGKSIMNEDYSGVQQYGMPSYHAQLSFFSIAFLYLVKKSTSLLIIETFIAFVTIYQRWFYRRHTIEQLFVGSVVGIILGYTGYSITSQFLVTNKSIQ
jgi:heme O synthase-like polyprenyltransferase